MKLYINDTSSLGFGTADLQLSTIRGSNTLREADPWDIINKISIADAKAWQNEVIESGDLAFQVEIEEVKPDSESLALIAYRIKLVCVTNSNLFLQNIVE